MFLLPARPREFLDDVLARLAALPLDRLWAPLHDAGALLALAGDVDGALAVWRRASSQRIPPDFHRAFGDAAISAVCHAAGRGDLSGGRPCPTFIKSAEPLAERVALAEQYTWNQRLTVDPWVHHPAPDAAAPATGIALFRRALRELHGPGGAVRPGTQAAVALVLLQRFLDEREADAGGIPVDVLLRARLLAAHLSAGAGAGEAAVRHLRAWYALGVESGLAVVEEELGLAPLASLIAAGALAPSLGLGDDAPRLAAALAERAAARIYPPPPSPPPPPLRVACLYSWFQLQPDLADPTVAHFQDPADARRGFSAARHQAGVATPAGTRECFVQYRVTARVPSLERTIQAVSFPLAVREGGVFLTGIDTHLLREADHLAVPPGDYDVLVRFFPLAPDDAAAALGPDAPHTLRVTLSFLPPDTLGARTFKLASLFPPET